MTDPIPILYQHEDGRYALSFGPARFAIGEPAWYRVPLDLIEAQRTSVQPAADPQPPRLTHDQMIALRDFQRTVIMDSAHSIDKSTIQHLAQLGALEPRGFGKHRLSAYGEWLLSTPVAATTPPFAGYDRNFNPGSNPDNPQTEQDADTEDALPDTTLLHELALAGLICKIIPGLDSGDILADAPAASAALSAQPDPATAAARDVLAERRRQVEAEGWTPEHDDTHVNDECE
ncbi:hypothetical protein [Pollutimonas bauzanensis]|uniref:Uncharacterized protein n=1 Tax=Pollutimonas bauzanensis TaxID=658167 RepID=A0A1M5YKT6_9BURK|nr:hypothetical protein [Pollutimonas bauzanensis]SHI12508.1 hypothetical protein SAMN04488135_109184 [Pollutimonas bauzanensis]